MSSGILVTRTSDGLAAFAMVTAQREASYPVLDEMLNELKNHGIVFGILTEVIQEMVTLKTINKQVKIAQGIAPLPGTDGRVEIAVDISSIGKPKVLADGRVDHHNIAYVLSVTKGEVLARHIPPVRGESGIMVTGKQILPLPPADKTLSHGAGTVISPLDQNLLVAEIDGGFWVGERGIIEVHNEKTITGDIDYQTGDINFPGDLTITGTVRSGFSVETKGSLVINGSVEDCKIKCKGNLVIKGGAFSSGSGRIECLGSVKVRHLENFNTTAEGEIVVSEDILHGTASAGKAVVAKAILGGTVASMAGIEADIVGSEAEIKTVLDIGKKYERLQERYRLLQKMSQLTTEVGNDKETVFQFVRNNLDENGTMSYDNEKMFETMKNRSRDLHKAFSEIQRELDELDILQVDGAVPYVKARVLYPNTLVKFGLGEQLIREKLERVRLLPVERGNTVSLSHEKTA
jgi:uncharacterized protein